MAWLAGHSILCALLCAGFILTYCVPSQCLPIPDLLRMGSGGAKGAYAPMLCATESLLEGEGRRIASFQRRTKKDKRRVYIVDSDLPVLCLSRRLPSGGHEYIFVSVDRDRGAPWYNSKLMQTLSAIRAWSKGAGNT